MGKIVVFIFVGCLLTGCTMNNNKQLNEKESQQEQMEVSEDTLQQRVDALLLAASKNEISQIENEISKIHDKQLDEVLVTVLLQWHLYRYEEHRADLKLVELLLKAGADPNSRVEYENSSEYGYPLLCSAVIQICLRF